MAIEGNLFFLDNSVMIIDSYRSIIVRDREGENFSIKLFLTLHSFIEFDNTSYDNSYTVSVLSIYDIKNYSIALHLAR